MKKLIGTFIIVSLILVGCGSTKLNVTLDEAPKYKDGVEYPISLSITDGDDAITELDVIATLEMARMDHGVIEVVFSDQGDGLYSSETALPMAGEWIADIELTKDGNTTEEVLTFDVEEE